MSYLEQLFSLEHRVAVVTGASRGIGKGIAEGLLGAGATVVLTATNERRVTETVAEFIGKDLKADGYVCDVADKRQIDGLVNHVAQKHKFIDILVNNAGITFAHSIIDYPDEVWERTIKVNLEAPFQLAKRFAPMMKRRGKGVIINVTSLNAELGFEDNAAYASSKGGLRQLTKSLAVDLGKHGIRVNAIGPGYFHTDMNAASWADPTRKVIRSERSILGRWGEPEEVAGLAIFLASDASSFVTGQDFYIDGGWACKGM